MAPLPQLFLSYARLFLRWWPAGSRCPLQATCRQSPPAGASPRHPLPAPTRPASPKRSRSPPPSAMVRPPPRRSRVIAAAPSLPMPVISTPTSRDASTCSIAESTSRSTLGCQRCCGRAAAGMAQSAPAFSLPAFSLPAFSLPALSLPLGPDHDIGIAPADIDVARRQLHGLRRFHHAHRAQPIQPPRQRAGKTRRHVLRHHDRPRKIRRQRRQQRVQRRRPAGGRSPPARCAPCRPKPIRPATRQPDEASAARPRPPRAPQGRPRPRAAAPAPSGADWTAAAPAPRRAPWPQAPAPIHRG